mmetsp:Transcript_36664/g.44866  ORF Transcript_36664/g.44866 Transcript_36664/m.44866 type:complete len:153 (-) Transcript_36664:712-1170(-)|eukprot:CAMPEP_0170461326 /NCGR_PEP_ID=MMETSP0123-20130129/7278_1 /TAXON_ID=182087 /ORGANISM="Favella ehrenbergii, Strain Fehren 1" /LENGTH=152 /DNA_ID=CAMNT_0010726327 /DNA_START=226 /DNA_END=684 /DNA_ORIENTATION=+
MASSSQKNLLEPHFEFGFTSPQPCAKKKTGRLADLSDDEDGGKVVFNKTLLKGTIASKSNGNILGPLQPVKYLTKESSTSRGEFSIHDKIMLSNFEEDEHEDEDEENPADLRVEHCYNYIHSDSSSKGRKSAITVHWAAAGATTRAAATGCA